MAYELLVIKHSQEIIAVMLLFLASLSVHLSAQKSDKTFWNLIITATSLLALAVLTNTLAEFYSRINLAIMSALLLLFSAFTFLASLITNTNHSTQKRLTVKRAEKWHTNK